MEISNARSEAIQVELLEARVVGISPEPLAIPGDTFDLELDSAPFAGEVFSESTASLFGSASFRHGYTCDNPSDCSWHTEVTLEVEGRERVLEGVPETGLFLHCDPPPE